MAYTLRGSWSKNQAVNSKKSELSSGQEMPAPKRMFLRGNNPLIKRQTDKHL
jgi:hypothetical protein